MNVEDLIGIRVWLRRDQFRRVSGIISSVIKPVNHDDFQSSLTESIFRIDLCSGGVIQVPGSGISKFDHGEH
jgi:hypothetical protein